MLPDWVDSSASGLENYIATDAGLPGIIGKIRNVYQGERSGIIIELIPGFTPTTTQKQAAMASLKKLWTEVIEETVTLPS